MTKRLIEALAAPDPSGKQTIYWAEGSDHPGLGILVSGTTAAKSWVVQGKLPGTGVARRVTLGPVAVLALEQAWERARPVLADIHAGIDPKAKKHKPATVREALEQYLAGNPQLRPKTVRNYRGHVERHLKPWLDLPIGAITPNMVEGRFLAISKEVDARRAALIGGKNITGDASANLALTVFRILFRDQQKRDPKMPERDPTSFLSRKWHELERRTGFIAPEQLPTFRSAITQLNSRLHRDLLTVALYTGWRRGEIEGLKWEEVNLPERTVTIPAARMKNKKPFSLPLSRQLAEVLIARRALGNDGPYVFPGMNGHTHVMGEALRKIAEATGIVVAPHDMRRTFVSIAEECPISAVAVKRLIAHSTSRDVTEGYVQRSGDQLRAAAQIVSDRIDALAGIAAPEGVERIGERA
jgi:integrase